MSRGPRENSEELPEQITLGAGAALAYLKVLADEFPGTPELKGHLDWLVAQCNKVGIEMDLGSLPKSHFTHFREREKKDMEDREDMGGHLMVSPLWAVTTDLENWIKVYAKTLEPSEVKGLTDLANVFKQTLGIRNRVLGL